MAKRGLNEVKRGPGSSNAGAAPQILFLTRLPSSKTSPVPRWLPALFAGLAYLMVFNCLAVFEV
jgi:hypothetical protein